MTFTNKMRKTANVDKAADIIFMFSGQGSQYYHMGSELYESNSYFRKCLNRLDECFAQFTGISALAEVYNKKFAKDVPFTRMLISHSVIYMFEYALTKLLNHHDIYPDYYFGTSLGEFTAATLALDVSPELVLDMLIEHSRLTEQNVPKGSMTAVICNKSRLDEILKDFETVEIAAHNFDTHFVVSGDHDSLRKLGTCLTEKNILFQNVATQFAFHSSSFDTLEPLINTKLIDRGDIFSPKCVFCSQASILSAGFEGATWDTIRKPINFSDTFSMFTSCGGSQLFLDLGPSGTLDTFVKNISSKSKKIKHMPILTPFGRDLLNLERVLEVCGQTTQIG